MPLTKKASLQDITDKKKHSKPKDKEARRDYSYSLIPRREDVAETKKTYADCERDACFLAESSSDTKLQKIQNKLRSGVTRSDTLLDAVAKCYSLHAPIEDKPCGDEASEQEDKDCDAHKKEFRSVSPCLTDPNSTALVNGSPQSLSVAFDSLDNTDIIDELEDPLLAGWDDDLFLYRSSDEKGLDILPLDGFSSLSCSGGDGENEDKFSSCYDDSDSEVDVLFGGSQERKNGEMKSCYSRSREYEARGKRSTSAPAVRLGNQRPATPWPATQTGEELLMNRAGERKAKILKTILVFSVIAILTFFWFPWYE